MVFPVSVNPKLFHNHRKDEQHDIIFNKSYSMVVTKVSNNSFTPSYDFI